MARCERGVMEQRDGSKERPVRLGFREWWPVGSLVMLLVFGACQYSLGRRYQELIDKDVRLRVDGVLVRSPAPEIAELLLVSPKNARIRGETGIRIPAGTALRITDVQCKYGPPGQVCHFIGFYKVAGVSYRFSAGGFREPHLRESAEGLWEYATSSEQDGPGRQSPK
jgi:hypothetical protein